MHKEFYQTGNPQFWPAFAWPFCTEGKYSLLSDWFTSDFWWSITSWFPKPAGCTRFVSPNPLSPSLDTTIYTAGVSTSYLRLLRPSWLVILLQNGQDMMTGFHHYFWEEIQSSSSHPHLAGHQAAFLMDIQRPLLSARHERLKVKAEGWSSYNT